MEFFTESGGAMMSMDWNLKRCCTSSTLLGPCYVDRLNSLPDDLLSLILSMLPTKDAAATQVLSKRTRQAFSWISSLDFDDSPVSYCHKRPHLVERFPLFESFVDNVLQQLSHSEQPLARFRLRLGRDETISLGWHECDQACFPVMEPSRLNAWISYPLAHCGLKELDLSFHVRNSYECRLPPGLFACQSLLVLRLDSNLEIDGAEIPLICLPHLKLLHLYSFVFTEDDFVTRLVSRCPSLEDLSIAHCLWMKSDHLTISSHSLRRLVLNNRKYDEEKNSDLVLIDTPNLQYLWYTDNIPYSYSVARLSALVEARIDIVGLLQVDTLEPSFRTQLVLERALVDVEQLSLLGTAAENYEFAGELKDQLPMYRNLRTLELDQFHFARWDIVLMSILHCSPFLETLVFPEGLFVSCSTYVCPSASDRKAAALEAEGWRTIQTIPSCCLSHLKRIVLNRCFGVDRELNMIKFLLSKASVLKELVICLTTKIITDVQFDAPDLDRFENTLEELPRASNSCSITVQR